MMKAQAPNTDLRFECRTVSPTMLTRFLAGVLLVGVVSLPTFAQPATQRSYSRASVIDLDANPEPNALMEIRAAFRAGAAVRLIAGSPKDLQRLLGVGLANHKQRPAATEGSVTQDRTVSAVQIGRSGVVRQFVHISHGNDPGDWKESFESWIAAAESRVGDPAAPSGAWTQIQELSQASQDPKGNKFAIRADIYRLNDISIESDWYMVLVDPQSQPNFTKRGCETAFNDCGYWTKRRIITLSADGAQLFDHGPTTEITTAQGGFSIGGSLSKDGPGINASYSESWSQASVRTRDQTGLTTQVAQWREDFTGRGTLEAGAPPATSTATFISHQGAIFQVPEGTTSFNLNIEALVTSTYYDSCVICVSETGGENNYDWSYSINTTILAPIFAVYPNALTIPSESSQVLSLEVSIPGSPLGLPWKLDNLPSWLTASQISGSGPAKITLTVAPGTPDKTVASLNFNTDPPFGAPSVTRNPLIVNVTVGQPMVKEGVVLTGGLQYSGSSAVSLATAELVYPDLEQIEPMSEPRLRQAATVLRSGKLLITGGIGSPRGAALNTTDTLDPLSLVFSRSAPMTVARVDHTATLLADGRVLVAGGLPTDGNMPALASAEIYDPATDRFTPCSKHGQREGPSHGNNPY